MKKTAYVVLLVFTLLFSALAAYGFTRDERGGETVSFLVKTQYGAEKILPHTGEDGISHVFLPAYCRMEDVSLQSAQQVILNGSQLEDGSVLSGLTAGEPYSMLVDGKARTICFWISENVASMHINTRSGSMDHIHADKANSESACVTLYTKDGQLDHADLVATLKGRGNATWECRKKPYNLTLSADAALLEMGSASKWVLLANALDESSLHNKLALEMARQTELGWTPQCEYVEVYFNGSYNGLYLLTEKIEIGADRLSLDPAQGDFLAAVEPNMREAVLDRPIRTRQGRVIELCEPEYPSGKEAEKVQMLEDAILSAGQGEFPAALDLDSWVKRYLIDEICANIDADLASSYFYYHDGTFFAGPVWDYDMSFGNQITNENPAAFVAANAVRSRRFSTPYDTALLCSDTFRARMTQVYETQFLPFLEQLLQGGILQMAQEISVARERNSLRWQEMYEKNPVTTTTAEDLVSYLEERVAFLSDAWLAGIRYCTLQFEVIPNGGACWNLSVPWGTCLEENYLELGEDFAYVGLNDLDSAHTQWVDAETGAPFDPKQPVTENLLLIQKNAPAAEPQVQKQAGSAAGMVAIGLILVMGVCFVCLVAADLRGRRQERSANNG